MASPIVILSERWPWFGGHSGYEPLSGFLRKAGIPVTEIVPTLTLPRRLAGRLYGMLKGRAEVNSVHECAELQLLCRSWRAPGRLMHVLYIEQHMSLLQPPATRLRGPLVVTVHQPYNGWSRNDLEQLGRPDSVVALHSDACRTFGRHTRRPVHFIRLAADTEFFSPSESNATEQTPRLVCVGHHLRDMPMLGRVLGEVLRRHRHVTVHVVASASALGRMRGALPSSERLVYQSGLGDDALLALYRSSAATLLPMVDSGASTAVVDALAAGLPPLTTDVGGIRDYGGGEVFPVVARDDDEAMVELALRYLDDAQWRRDVGERCRAFAETNLQWGTIASQHLALYQETLQEWSG